MNGIDNIIFDLGGVLVDVKIAKSVEAFAKLKIAGLDVSDIHPHQQGVFLEYELGQISSEEFIRRLREEFNCANVTDDEIWRAWNVLLEDIDIKRFKLLDRLRERYKVFLLSNTNEAHMKCVKERFRKISGGREFESYFDGCFYSHTMHLRKPDVRIYNEVIAESGVVPQKTVFIDDNDCNFSGAFDAGLNVYHLSEGKTVFDIFKY